MSDTPRTDKVASFEGSWDTKALRMTELAGNLERELAEAQTTLQFAKKEYHALFREFSILVKQRDTLAEALRKIDRGDMLGWCGQVAHNALAAVKGGEA
jgi:hypothetical protein